MNRRELPNPPQNRLLASLSQIDYARLHSLLDPVQLPYRDLLYQASKPIQFVYFLETGVASLVNTMRNGEASEIGTIGNEGIVGVPIVLGDTEAPNSIYMQVPGAGLKLRSGLLSLAIEQSSTLKTALLHY